MKAEDKTKEQLIKELALLRQRIAELEVSETERKRVEEALSRHARRVEALHAIAATVSQTLDMDELLNSALEKVIEVMGADGCSIYLLDVAQKALVLEARKARYVEVIGEMQVMRLDEEEIENVLQWKDLNIPLSEVFGETSLSLIAKAAKEYEVQSLATAPFSAKGEIYQLQMLIPMVVLWHGWLTNTPLFVV